MQFNFIINNYLYLPYIVGHNLDFLTQKIYLLKKQKVKRNFNVKLHHVVPGNMLRYVNKGQEIHLKMVKYLKII